MPAHWPRRGDYIRRRRGHKDRRRRDSTGRAHGPRSLSMSSVSADTYRRIDNEVYNREGDLWWQKDTVLHLLKTSVNPALVGYFRRMLFEELKLRPVGETALDVRCGRGIFCQEIAPIGIQATLVDP